MSHVVTKPTAPFKTRDGSLVIHQIPAAEDNLIWLLVCQETGDAYAVDGPECASVLAYCEKHGIELRGILNTHTHLDHVGINHGLMGMGKLEGMKVVGPGSRPEDVPGITQRVGEGDTVEVGAVVGRAMLTEGHIDGHISYVFDDVVFCGDTLFGAGCGYLFDGPPAKMKDSLDRLASLSEGTRVCCAHEYTEDNLRFAFSVEPDNEALAQRIRDSWALRAEGGCTVPSTVAVERATNPFLRHDSATILAKVREAFPDRPLSTPAEIFAATRALKDLRHYRALGDAPLPL